MIGIDNITWECDYPHSDSTWPEAPEVLMKSLERAELTDDEIEKVTWQNAARWYQFDPFQHRSRKESTVGALRAQAGDVDTTPREYGQGDHSHGLSHNASQFLDAQTMR
ncbi:MAG: amidohydrolase family protein, partial [Actinomycetota bacterium]|nr:amidohydrolase family protein [Actinomycetota bacterium]